MKDLPKTQRQRLDGLMMNGGSGMPSGVIPIGGAMPLVEHPLLRRVSRGLRLQRLEETMGPWIKLLPDNGSGGSLVVGRRQTSGIAGVELGAIGHLAMGSGRTPKETLLWKRSILRWNANTDVVVWRRAEKVLKSFEWEMQQKLEHLSEEQLSASTYLEDILAIFDILAGEKEA